MNVKHIFNVYFSYRSYKKLLTVLVELFVLCCFVWRMCMVTTKFSCLHTLFIWTSCCVTL